MTETQPGCSDKDSNTQSMFSKDQGVCCPGCKISYSWIQEDCVPTSLTCGHSLCFKCVKGQWCNPDSNDASVFCIICSSRAATLAQNAETYQDLITSEPSEQTQLTETASVRVHHCLHPEMSTVEDTKPSSLNVMSNQFQSGDQKHQQAGADVSGNKDILPLMSSPSQSFDKILSQDDAWRLLQRDEGFIRDWIVANVPDHIIFKMVGSSSLDLASASLPSSVADVISCIPDGDDGNDAPLFSQPQPTTASSLSTVDSGATTQSERERSLPSMSSFLGDSSTLSCSGRQLWQYILNKATQDKSLRSGQQQDDGVTQHISSLSQLTATPVKKAPEKGQPAREKLLGGMALPDRAPVTTTQDKSLTNLQVSFKQMDSPGMGCVGVKENEPAAHKSSSKTSRNLQDMQAAWLEPWTDGSTGNMVPEPDEGKLNPCSNNHSQYTNSSTQTWMNAMQSHAISDVPENTKSLACYSVTTPINAGNKNPNFLNQNLFQGKHETTTWTGTQYEAFQSDYYQHRTCCTAAPGVLSATPEQQQQGEAFCLYPTFSHQPRHHPYLMQESMAQNLPLRRARARRYGSEAEPYCCMSPSPFLRARTGRIWRGRGSYSVRRMKSPMSPSLTTPVDSQWYSEACAPSLSHLSTHLSSLLHPQLQVVQVVRQKNEQTHDTEQDVMSQEPVSASTSTPCTSAVIDQEQWDQAGRRSTEAEVALMKMREMPSGPCVEDIYVVPPVWLCNNSHQGVATDCSDSQLLEAEQCSPHPSDGIEDEPSGGVCRRMSDSLVEAARMRTKTSELSMLGPPGCSTSFVEVTESQGMQTDIRPSLPSTHEYLDSEFQPVAVMTSIPSRTTKRETFAAASCTSQLPSGPMSHAHELSATACGKMDFSKEKFHSSEMQAVRSLSGENEQVSLSSEQREEGGTSDGRSDERSILDANLDHISDCADLDVSSTSKSGMVDLNKDFSMPHPLPSSSYSSCPEKNEWFLTDNDSVQASSASLSTSLSETACAPLRKNMAGIFFNRMGRDPSLENSLLPNDWTGMFSPFSTTSYFQPDHKKNLIAPVSSSGTQPVSQQKHCHPYIRPNAGRKVLNRDPATLLSSVADCLNCQTNQPTMSSHHVDRRQHQQDSEHPFQSLASLCAEREGVFQKPDETVPPCMAATPYPYTHYGHRGSAGQQQTEGTWNQKSLEMGGTQKEGRNNESARVLGLLHESYFPSKVCMASQTEEESILYQSEQEATSETSLIEGEHAELFLSQHRLEQQKQVESSTDMSDHNIQAILQEFSDLGCATGNPSVCSLLEKLLILDVARQGVVGENWQSLDRNKTQKPHMDGFLSCIIALSHAVVKLGQTLYSWSQLCTEETEQLPADHMTDCLNSMFETGLQHLSEMVLLYCDSLQGIEGNSVMSEHTQQPEQPQHHVRKTSDPSQQQFSSSLDHCHHPQNSQAFTVPEQEFVCQHKASPTYKKTEKDHVSASEAVFDPSTPETQILSTTHPTCVLSQEEVCSQADLSVSLSSCQHGSETCTHHQTSNIVFSPPPVLSDANSTGLCSLRPSTASESQMVYLAFNQPTENLGSCPDATDLPAMFTVAEEDCEPSIQCPEEEVISEVAVVESEAVEVTTEVLVCPDLDCEPPELLRQEDSLCVHVEDGKCNEPPVLQPLEQGGEQMMEEARQLDPTTKDSGQAKITEGSSKKTNSDTSISDVPVAKEDKENVRCLRSLASRSELGESQVRRATQKNRKAGPQKKGHSVQDLS